MAKITDKQADGVFRYCPAPSQDKLAQFSLFRSSDGNFCIIGRVVDDHTFHEKTPPLYTNGKGASQFTLEGTYRMLWIKDSPNFDRPLQEIAFADPTEYTKEKINQQLEEPSQTSTGLSNSKYLSHLSDFHALIGFIRFVKGYYMFVVKEYNEAGRIGKHRVYTIKRTDFIPLFKAEDNNIASSTWKRIMNPQSPSTLAEERYKGLIQLLDLSKSFYWSYSYNLALSLQSNVSSAWKNSFGKEDDSFVWNHFLGEEIAAIYGLTSTWDCPWTIHLIYGSFEQQRCSIFGQGLTITLIGRRSRFFAGTRYLKRGISDTGKVANEVEIEQIVQDESIISRLDNPSISSYVQVRGSIPTYWTQETSVAVPKPPIDRFRYDPSFKATRCHFEDLMARYGAPIIILDLVKQQEKNPRESMLAGEFRSAVSYLNKFIENPKLKLRYLALDFARLSKHPSPFLLQALQKTADNVLSRTQQFAVTRESSITGSFSKHESILDYETDVPLKWSEEFHDYVPFRPEEEREVSATYIENINESRTNISTEDETESDPGLAGLNDDTFRCENALFSSDTVQDQEQSKYFAASSSPSHFSVLRQEGVVRTNCIDGLDRTNVAQFCIGLRVLRNQLALLGIARNPDLDRASKLVVVLMDMYEELGDRIAIQYGGSSAHRKSSKLMLNVESVTKQKELFTYAKRYYSNSFTDHAKQDAINLFLGLFKPYDRKRFTVFGASKIHIWDLESDFYLHNKAVLCSTDGAVNLNNHIRAEKSWYKNGLRMFAANVIEPLECLRERLEQVDYRQHSHCATHMDHVEDMGYTSFDEMLLQSKLKPIEIGENLQISTRKNGENQNHEGKVLHKDKTSNSKESISSSEYLTAFGIEPLNYESILHKSPPKIYTQYERQYQDPFSLYKSNNTEDKERAKEKEQTYLEYMRDQLISENDAWGMKRMQAHAGNTLVLLKGVYKGFPRDLYITAVIFQEQKAEDL